MNEGWLRVVAGLGEVPSPLLRPISGRIVIDQAVTHSKERNRLFAADTKAKTTGTLHVEFELELETEGLLALRTGSVAVTAPDGTVTEYPADGEGA